MHSHVVRAALHVASFFGMYLSGVMLLPAAVDLYYGHDDWKVFVFSAFFTGGLAAAVAFATQSRPPVASPRFGFLLVNVLWLTMALAGIVPFMMSSLDMSLADAVYESVSGITATGGTVINGVDSAPPGILLWRSLLQWIGGLGVIALGLFLLPFLNIGGVTYFRIESSDIEDRPFERFATFAFTLIAIYAGLTFTCAIAYSAGGMGSFDALNHAMTTISTAGLSTHDTSFARYADNYVILWTSIFFMVLGALPSSILILFAVRGRTDALGDPQIKVFLGYTAAFALAVAVYLRVTTGMPFTTAITQSTFTFVSIITTTGYATNDYSTWGHFVVTCAFLATFLGGCSGSTSGGIKAYRFLILFELISNGLKRLIYPNMVLPVRYGDRPVEEPMQRAVVLFISAFMTIWLIATLMLAATGMDLTSSMTGALGSLANLGPGLGDQIGPAGNYSGVPDSAKYILSVVMLLGRLEILAVLVILTPAFWGRR